MFQRRTGIASRVEDGPRVPVEAALKVQADFKCHKV